MLLERDDSPTSDLNGHTRSTPMATKAKITIPIRDPQIPSRIEGRKTVLIDTCVWIDLGDGKTAQDLRISQRLRELVRAARLFCPLTFTTVCELFKQDNSSAVSIASLMEELSLNISFELGERIYDSEIDAVVRMTYDGSNPRLGPAEIFGPVLGCQGLQLEADKHPSQLRQQILDEVMRLARNFGIVELLSLSRQVAAESQETPPAYAATAQRRKDLARGSREKARRIEEEAALHNFIGPRLGRWLEALPVHLREDFCQRIVNLPGDQYGGKAGYLLKMMPGVKHYIDVMTAVGLDAGRRDKENDFFDRDLILAPFVYSDVFVTWDKDIKNLLTRAVESGIAETKQCFWTKQAFEDYLETFA